MVRLKVHTLSQNPYSFKAFLSPRKIPAGNPIGGVPDRLLQNSCFTVHEETEFFGVILGKVQL